MWRIGVATVAFLILVENSSADIQYGTIERVKRSPNYYNCPPYYPPPPHRHPHFYPPPPYWPPPPPPPPPLYWQQNQQLREQQKDEISSNVQSESQSKVTNENEKSQDHTGVAEPCDQCSGQKGQNTATSNAESDTGSAVAIAIAKAKNN